MFIGAINIGQQPRGGEEYKNQLLYSKLKKEYPNSIIVDTSRWTKNPLVMLKLFYNLVFIKKSDILLSTSSLSAYRFIVLLNFLKPSELTKIHYLVVGGYFPDAIENKRFNWSYYRHLKNIIVEGNLLKIKLEANSILKNVNVIPNFKEVIGGMELVSRGRSTQFKFVFIGRISLGKGIEEIIKATEILKLQNNGFSVDFYGPVEVQFQLNDSILNYQGFLDIQGDPIQSYTKLSKYDCMLFPTYWIGEGFPGVIVDAFIAGLPVIASDWNMNTEVIEDGMNGFIIDPRNSDALAEKMIWVMENRDQLEKIRQNNLEKAKHYHIDTVWPKLMDCVLQ